MRKVLEIINQLQRTSGRLDKERILKNNKDNELLKDVLHFVFNPYIISGLSDKKIKKFKIDRIKEIELSNVEDIFKYLEKKNTGRDEDIKNVLGMIKIFEDQEIRNLLISIVTKSLKIGATAKTLNKIYGEGFIPEFNVMLAESYFKNDNDKKLLGDFIITTKLDGIRCAVIREGEGVKFFSRQGQPIIGLEQLEKEFLTLPEGMVYDGELLLRNDNRLPSDELYRETMKVVRKDGIKKNVEFHMFDVLPLGDFMKGKCNTKCIDRKFQLHELVAKDKNFEYIIEVPMLYVGNDQSQIFKLLKAAKDNNEEGVMLNKANAPYECKRSKGILKVKVMQTCDIKCIGFEEGSGANTGRLGAMLVNYKGNEVGVGSGFKEEERIEIWNNKEKYLGKIAEIQYFEESTNQNDNAISLRFPVFKSWRLDKTEESYN